MEFQSSITYHYFSEFLFRLITQYQFLVYLMVKFIQIYEIDIREEEHTNS